MNWLLSVLADSWIAILWRLRWEDIEFGVSQGYIVDFEPLLAADEVYSTFHMY